MSHHNSTTNSQLFNILYYYKMGRAGQWLVPLAFLSFKMHCLQCTFYYAMLCKAQWWWWWTEPSTRWISDLSKLRLVDECEDVHSPILDAQERPQTSQAKLAAFKYVPVFRCSRLVSSVRTRPASNCWTEVLQCDRQSDRSSTSSSSSGGAMSQRFKLAFRVSL